MSKNLVIVESPAKAKTIESYLGKEYVVKSSFGHIRDLGKKGLSINIDQNFEPEYEVSVDKKQVVSDLKKCVKQAETVWLATDEDREGEAISWHLFETLELDEKNTKRITFNEITKSAVTKAIQNPRKINKALVDAQQARRVLDRIVGFELSPVLWRKVKPNLSAGRVQSVAVRLIVEREDEIRQFTVESSFKTYGKFQSNTTEFKAELTTPFDDEAQAKSFLEGLTHAVFNVANLETKPGKKSASPPFTTSTLQQEASVKLGFNVARTMVLAQRLYEAGHITYMRTDSTNLSETAMVGSNQEIIQRYGEKYASPTKYATKNANAQEAHEAIRPTNFQNESIDGERDEQRLYELIWRRTMASQMAPAVLEKTTISIANDQNKALFVAKGEVIRFDGFLKVYGIDTNTEEEEQSGLLPAVEVGQTISLNAAESIQRFSRPPARYTEASLVKKMEELGIGRPSTYAPTISTIQQRNYVVKNESEGDKRAYTVLSFEDGKVTQKTATETVGADRNRMVPTDIGALVTAFLKANFSHIMDYQFTAQVEEEFDHIANGKMQWNEMLRNFYQPFHAGVEETLENSGRVTGERELGTDPQSGKRVIARMGRFGPMIQIGEETEDAKPQFASLLKNQSIQTITLEQALELFKLPRILGEYNEETVKVNIGKFGPYVQLGKVFVSIPKEESPMEIVLERAIELIDEKLKAAAENTLKTFDERPDVLVLKGKYGPYLKVGKNNYKLPANSEPEKLTLEECIQLSETQSASNGKKNFKRKK